MYYTYILKNSVTNRYYIGFTPDLKNRLEKHKNGQIFSTKSNLNYNLEWYCAFTDWTGTDDVDFTYDKTGSLEQTAEATGSTNTSHPTQTAA